MVMNAQASGSSLSGTVTPQLLADFRADWEDASHAISAALVRLDSTPGQEPLNELFRELHTLKGSLRMVGLLDGAALLHQLEDFLDDLRQGVQVFEGVYGDLIQNLIERLAAVSLRLLAGEATAWSELAALPPLLQRLHGDPGHARHHAADALALLDQRPPARPDLSSVPLAADLAFFEGLAALAEIRSGRTSGALERQQRMAREMNALASQPVDASQLRVAVALHDVGMAFLPAGLFEKPAKLSAEDVRQLRTHPRVAAELLTLLPHWAEARQMILQHHEWVDGSGYPHGDRLSAIHPGAGLLAVVDTFEAITHKRAYRNHQRPMMRAVAEINGLVESQFDPVWVEVFNRWLRQVFEPH